MEIFQNMLCLKNSSSKIQLNQNYNKNIFYGDRMQYNK